MTKKVFIEVSQYNNLDKIEDWILEQVGLGFKTVIVEVLDE